MNAVILTTICGCSKTNGFLDYYCDNIIYFNMNNITNSNFDSLTTFKIFCTVTNLRNEKQIFEMERMLYYDNRPSEYFRASVSRKFNSIVFSVKDGEDVFYMESMLTKIRNFDLFTLSFDSNWVINQEKTGWNKFNLSSNEFCDLFLKKYDFSLDDYCYGYNAYPNLYQTFYINLIDPDKLNSLKCGNVYAFDVWMRIENDFYTLV